MKITGSQLRQIIREALDSSTEHLLDDAADLIEKLDAALDDATKSEPGSSQRLSAHERLSRTLGEISALEGLEIGENEEELAYLESQTGMGKDEITALLRNAMIAHVEERDRASGEKKLSSQPAGVPSVSVDDPLHGKREPFFADWEKRGWGPNDPFPDDLNKKSR